MLDAGAVAQLLGGKSAVKLRSGNFRGLEGSMALVDMGYERFPVQFLTGQVPLMNELVHVLTVDGYSYLVGPVVPRPGVGTVVSVAGDEATVSTDIGTYAMTFGGSLAPGDKVGVSWSSVPWCVKLTAVMPTPAPEPPPVPPAGASTTKVQTFKATATGTTHPSGDWWSQEVWSAVGNDGAWFYGNQIRDTIPAGATLVSLEVLVARHYKFGADPSWGLHNLGSRSGVPSFTGVTDWNPAGNGWQKPPMAAAWFNALKEGGSARGIGLPGGGYHKFRSRTQDPMSGALRIKWKV